MRTGCVPIDDNEGRMFCFAEKEKRMRLATITLFTASLLLWSVSALSDSLSAAEDVTCNSSPQHSGIQQHAGRTCPIPGHQHPAGQPCPMFGQGLGHSLSQSLGFGNRLGDGHGNAHGSGMGLGKGFGFGKGFGLTDGKLSDGKGEGHGLGNRLGDGLKDGFGVGMGHNLGQRLGPDALEAIEDIDAVRLPMFIPVPVPVRVPMPVGTPPESVLAGVFTPQQYQQVQPMIMGQGGYLMPPGYPEGYPMVGPDGMPLQGQSGGYPVLGPDGMPLQGPGYQRGYAYAQGYGYNGYGYGYDPGYIPQQRIVYVPYAAPPPIYVERLAKGLPLTIPKLRRMLGDATMYEYPEMPLRTYTTRGPRDFLATNPPGIGY